MKPKQKDAIVEILQLRQVRLVVYLLGNTPLVMNRMTKKAREELLLPARKKNRASLEAAQKHNPPDEYRDSVYRCRDPKAPTLVHFPTNSFKKAMAQAAIDIPGAAKAQIGRLVSIADETVHIYGVPYLHMAVVRQAGINKAPDIRTRAIFPQWACKLTISYIGNLLTESNVINLIAAAGIITGIGDGRTEKGTFDFGRWDIVSKDDKRWHDVVSKQGRKPQEAALAKPIAFDADSEELLAWYDAEVIRREIIQPKKPKHGPLQGKQKDNGRREVRQ